MSFTRYMETNSTDPAYNLAFEEYILRNRQNGDYLMLWQNDNTIVIGQNQNALEEINPEAVKEKKIHVIRRTTGGGAVYHDLGNLNYSFITDVEDASMLSFSKLAEPMVQALRNMGLNAEVSGRNDILIDGKKVSGTAQRIIGKRVLHHGTLLFCSNLDAVSDALRVHPLKMVSKSTKSVRSRVGNICESFPKDVSVYDFWDMLKKQLLSSNFEGEELSENEIAEILKLKTEKYDTWEWNYGRSPKYELSNTCKYDGGILEVCLTVNNGAIDEIDFFGDFMAKKDISPIREALKGQEYRVDVIRMILNQFNLNLYFGDIQKSEILNTMFPTEY